MEIVACNSSDVPALKSFIDRYWSAGHILSRSDSVLEWYYKNETGYNFLLAKHEGEIQGVLGYLDFFKKANSSSDNSEIWLALWAVKPDTTISGVGLKLLFALIGMFKTKNVLVAGLSDQAANIYKVLKYKVDYYRHYFIANRKLDTFNLLHGEINSERVVSSSEITVEEITNFSRLECSNLNDVRNRNKDYFVEKYDNHPWFDYKFFFINNGEASALVVGKLDEYSGSSALRIVDVWGTLSSLTDSVSWFQSYIEANSIEYMDIYVWDREYSDFENSGFTLRSKDNNLIVPNYFSPFVMKNVDLRCAMLDSHNGPIFKGDGDQERPNESKDKL